MWTVPGLTPGTTGWQWLTGGYKYITAVEVATPRCAQLLDALSWQHGVAPHPCTGTACMPCSIPMRARRDTHKRDTSGTKAAQC